MTSKFLTSITKLATSSNKEVYLHSETDNKFSAARILLTGLLKNQFYKSQDETLKEAIAVFTVLAKQDPNYLLKAISFARNSNMKGMVLIATATLYSNTSEEFFLKNRNNIFTVLKSFNLNNLNDFMMIFKTKSLGKGFGIRLQKLINDIICSYSPDTLSKFTLKYPASLKNILINSHPKLNDEQSNVVKYLLDKNKNNETYSLPYTTEQKAVEQIKSLCFEKDKKTVAELIIENNIPFDCIKSNKGFNKDIVGAALTSTMSLSALLKNIVSFSEVYSNEIGLQLLKTRLQETRKGRFIPIDYVKPYMNSNDQKIKNVILDELADRLDHDFEILNNLNIGVSVDCSGSMGGEPIITAGLLAFPFTKAKNAWVTKFNTGIFELNLSNNKRENLNQLINIQVNGGTNVAAPISAATANKKNLDLMIIITDEQQNFGTSLMTAWKQYKKSINSDAELWIINASNYEWHSTDFKDDSVTVYHTMTPQIFHNIQYFGQNLVDLINNYEMY